MCGLASALLIVAFIGRDKPLKYEVYSEPHEVISAERAKSRSVHDDINPAMMLHLDNGDSIRVSVSKPIPDTIWYEYRKIIKD